MHKPVWIESESYPFQNTHTTPCAQLGLLDISFMMVNNARSPGEGEPSAGYDRIHEHHQ